MDLINRATTQLYDLLRSMTPSGRLTLGAAVLMVFLSIGYLSVHEVSPTYVDLMHGVPVAAADMPAMEAAFAKAKLKRYDIRGTSIYVPRGQEGDYMAALATGKALPKKLGAALYDAVMNGSMMEIGSERDRERLKIAKQEVLAQAIGEMHGVDHAVVLFDIDNRPGGFKDKLITASAFVTPAGSGQLDERLVPAIRGLLVGAIAGLKPENVTVSDSTGRAWRGTLEGGGGSGENRYISLKRAYEQDLKVKILNALCKIPNVTVETNIALSAEHRSQAKGGSQAGTTGNEQHDDRQPTSDDHRSAPSPSPLLQPNMAAMLKAVIGGSQENDSGKSDEFNRGPDEHADNESIDPTPIVARVTIGVPMDYFRQIWRKQNPAQTESDLRSPDPASLEQIRTVESAKIQAYVAQLLPMPAGAARATELVTVTAFADVAPDNRPIPTLRENLLSWARNSWRMLGIIALAMTALLTLRSMFARRPAVAEANATPDVAGADAPEAIAQAPRVPRPHARRFHEASRSTRDELSELIEHDPDTAANVLRNWIGQVG